MAQTIQFRRGLEANRTGITPAQGEPLWTTDDKKLYVGDGSTAGGIDLLSSVAANYILLSEKGAANGVATLDADSKIPTTQLPAIAITDTFVVASQAEMLALTAQTGDVAVRTDTNETYILKGTDPTTLSEWTKLATPTDAVTSVNGQTGVVTLGTDEVAEGTTNLYFTDTRADARADLRVQAAINDAGPSASDELYSSQKIEAMISDVLFYQGSWDANTNSPTLSDATGTDNFWYKVSVAGTQDLGSGSIDFNVGDDVIFNGTVWERFGNESAVDSVNGQTGTIVLDSDDISEGAANLYFTDARADARIAAASIDDLNDVDTSTTAPTANQVLTWDDTNSEWIPGDQNAGVTEFINLTDTPNAYTGEANKFVKVNSSGDALVFSNLIDGGLF